MKLDTLWCKLFKPSWHSQFMAEQKAIIAAELVKLGAYKAQADAILADIDDKIRRTYR